MFRPTVTTFHRMAARAAASASSTSGGVRVCGGVRSTAVVSSYATPSAALVAAPHAGVSSAVMRAEVGGETLLDMKALSPVVLLAIMRILQVITWLGCFSEYLTTTTPFAHSFTGKTPHYYD
eukprot:TRINITY_DN17_c0_g1_i5.p1 TRINITY_DN17_c0_g1~~TRINITY_DN17_c0_g1_i5.p1  ORF type:complete len:122 (+),score=13.31 TRINITY_DN17_c0_g1_i5:53-418(+)